MFNFDEAKVLQEHKNGLSIVGATEKAVDEVIKRGYKNIFYIGIGGTVLYANQMAHIVREEGSTIPLFIENAADFCVVDNPHFSKDSVVVIESISGDTKEVVAAVDKAHEIGATVIGYVEKEGSPLYEKSDYLITTTGGGYYFWYTVTLRFMYHAGQFPRYEKFFEELKNMPENVVEIYKKADEKAAEYATLQSSVLSAARRGYVDTIIEAEDTRKYVIGAFEMLYTKREDRPSKKHGTV